MLNTGKAVFPPLVHEDVVQRKEALVNPSPISSTDWLLIGGIIFHSTQYMRGFFSTQELRRIWCGKKLASFHVQTILLSECDWCTVIWPITSSPRSTCCLTRRIAMLLLFAAAMSGKQWPYLPRLCDRIVGNSTSVGWRTLPLEVIATLRGCNYYALGNGDHIGIVINIASTGATGLSRTNHLHQSKIQLSQRGYRTSLSVASDCVLLECTSNATGIRVSAITYISRALLTFHSMIRQYNTRLQASQDLLRIRIIPHLLTSDNTHILSSSLDSDACIKNQNNIIVAYGP